MQFKTLAFLSILSLLFFSGCFEDDKSSKENEKDKIEAKQKIKENTINLKTLDNKPITIIKRDNKYEVKQYPNKIILLNFFATWCPPCKAEIPNLIELQEKYNKDFQVISILMEKDKTNEDIKEFSSQFNINFDITNSKENFKLAKKIGEIKSIPTLYMLDKYGEVFQKYVGLVPVEMMEIDINKVLKK
ncbi:MAG: TlpA family protein disulfide reductase [Campylobacterota bacterium]